MMKKFTTLILGFLFILSLAGCNVPTVPDDCEGAECDADYCELNPEDMQCQNDDNPDDDDDDPALEDSLQIGLAKQEEATSVTETTTYYSKLGDDVADVTLAIDYEEDGENIQLFIERTLANEYGDFSSYYIYNLKETTMDYYESSNMDLYYSILDIEIDDTMELDNDIAFSDEYTMTETTISTYDYDVYHTTFLDFNSLKTLVEGYYNYAILRNVPMSLFVNHIDEVPVDIYVSQETEEIERIEVDFLSVVNDFRSSVQAELYTTIEFSITYENYNDVEVELPTNHQPTTFVPSMFVYDNQPTTFDMVDVDYPIDQAVANPAGTTLFLLDSENDTINVLDYDTLENTPITFDNKPMTMVEHGGLLYVGTQVQITQGYEEPTTNNGEIIVYNMNTLEVVDTIGILYDPTDIIITDYGQIVVTPATGQQSMMVVYTMDGTIINQFNVSEGVQMFASRIDNRIYTYAYWQGPRKVFDLDENGMVEDSYYPDNFYSYATLEPHEYFVSPDGFSIFTPRGIVLLSSPDESIDGSRYHILGLDVHHMEFEQDSFYISGQEGVYQFDNATLVNQALYSTPLPSIFFTLDGNQIITINEVSSGDYVMFISTIDGTCVSQPDASSCNDYDIKDLSYNPITLDADKQAILALVEEEITLDGATFLAMKELDDYHYLITYEKGETELVIYVESDGTSIQTIDAKEVTDPGVVTEEELQTLMRQMMQSDTCDDFVGQGYYLCQETDVRPYLLLDNYYNVIDGEKFRYSAVKEDVNYMHVFYEGVLVRQDGQLLIRQLRVIDESFDQGMDIYAQELMFTMFEKYSRDILTENLCDGYFVEQDQTDFCNQMFTDRFGLGLHWDILWDYEGTGRNAIEIEFSDMTIFQYRFYYDVIVDSEYNLFLDFELIEVIDPSTEISDQTATAITDQFLQRYQKPSSQDICELYLSTTNEYLNDMCYLGDTHTFKGSNNPFFDYEFIANLGDDTFEIKGFDDSYPDYYETYTVSFVFEDNRWLISDISWEPTFSITVEDAETYITDLFHEVGTYNDYEYCHFSLGVAYTDIPDDCRIALIQERLIGMRYQLLSITEDGPATFTIVYQKQSISSTEIITSEVHFIRGDRGTITYIENVLSTIDQHLIDGTLQERIEAQYAAYLIDLFDDTIDSSTLYTTYINSQYDETDFETYRTALLSSTETIAITSIDMVVDYRYQIYYDITYDITDLEGNVITDTISVKLDTIDSLGLAPLNTDVTYHINPSEVDTYIEDLSDSMRNYYFASFNCSDYISVIHPNGCATPEDYAFFADMLDGPDIILIGENTFTIRYALDSGLVMREYEFVLVLEEGTIRLADHTIVVDGE